MITLGRFPDGTERRAALELRAAGGRRLTGYASVFNAPAMIGGQFRETVKPGAFRASLATPCRDTLALLDHDLAKVLARTSNGSLKLAEDSRGLHFEMEAPHTTAGDDALELVRAGLAGGASFGFRATSERWPTADQRELLAVDLFEVSVVSAIPAYSETSVAARSAVRDAARYSAAVRIRAMALASL